MGSPGREAGAGDPFTIVTPSFATDYQLFRELHESVQRFAPLSKHTVIVPRADRSLFARIDSSQLEIVTVEEVMPRHVVSTPGWGGWLNLARPWPPIRGCVMQQITKLEVARQAPTPRVLLLDSDCELNRRVDAGSFDEDGLLPVYEVPGGVTAQMRRHLRSHRVAHAFLGLPAPPTPPLSDHITPVMMWDRDVVRELLDHVERVGGRSFWTILGRELHVSEFILYGVFARTVLGVAATTQVRCLEYWHDEPLDDDAARHFVAGLEPAHLAVMISAKSGADLLCGNASITTSSSSVGEGQPLSRQLPPFIT
jgi:hypothetical protein